MNWQKLESKLDALRTRRRSIFRVVRRVWRRVALLLAVVGPGLIVSNVNNESGGIYSYALSGAQFGYTVLWAIPLMGIGLYISEEMCARMGAVTGKGLSDLIREEFGFRVTFFVMAVVLVVNFGNVLAEFAGVAMAMEVFGVSKYISVPLAAVLVWVVVVMGSAKRLEGIFMAGCAVYLSYVVSAFYANPDWLRALLSLLPPPAQWLPGVREYVTPPELHTGYFLILAALVGSTIAPWQHFYLQAAVVEKRVGPRDYKKTQTDVLVGSVTGLAVVFFIIVATAATLHTAGTRYIASAADAARALEPLAGPNAAILFSFGLLNASLFAAIILPLSTAYVICEGLGFESGVDRSMREAPIFYGLYTGLIALGAALILFPRAPLVKIAVLSQVGNGFLLPFILVFILMLVNRRDLMGDRVNGKMYNFLAWTTSVAAVVLTLVVVYYGIFGKGGLATVGP